MLPEIQTGNLSLDYRGAKASGDLRSGHRVISVGRLWVDRGVRSI